MPTGRRPADALPDCEANDDDPGRDDDNDGDGDDDRPSFTPAAGGGGNFLRRGGSTADASALGLAAVVDVLVADGRFAFAVGTAGFLARCLFPLPPLVRPPRSSPATAKASRSGTGEPEEPRDADGGGNADHSPVLFFAVAAAEAFLLFFAFRLSRCLEAS